MMENLANKVVAWLFETGAIKVSPADKPFWYTSGLIGPYYVNTHFLFGSEQKAAALLKLMDEQRDDLPGCSHLVRKALWENYQVDPIFKQLTDALVAHVQECYDVSKIDYISGGERRDWFFSMLPAELLGKQHLTISKEQQVVLQEGDRVRTTHELSGKNVLHISDLVTEASSYIRAWIPALQKLGLQMLATITIVDRKQGGEEALRQAGVPLRSLIRVDESLFHSAHAQGYLTNEQLLLVSSYLADPHASMRQFLLDCPEFLQGAMQGDQRTRERAVRLISQDLYSLK